MRIKNYAVTSREDQESCPPGLGKPVHDVLLTATHSSAQLVIRGHHNDITSIARAYCEGVQMERRE